MPLPRIDRLYRALALLLILCLHTAALPVQARVITDMSGRQVSLPDTVTKVVGVSPPATYLLYAIDPSLLAEGGGGYRLFDGCVRKINLFNLPRLQRLGLIHSC